MLKRISSIVLISVLLCSMFSGCSEAVEVDDDVYAVVLGLDKGTHNKLMLTIEYPTYKDGGGGGMPGGGGERKGKAEKAEKASSYLVQIYIRLKHLQC